MRQLLIILFLFWVYFIISFIVLWLTKKRPKLRKPLLIILSILAALAFLGFVNYMSIRLLEHDWVIISTIYLAISLAMPWTQFKKNRILKVSGAIVVLIFMFLIFRNLYIDSLIRKEPYQYLMSRGDYEHLYLTLQRANRVLPDDQMDSLLVRIFSNSMRLDCFGYAFELVKNENRHEFKALIEKRIDYFSSFPNDTTWNVVIKKRKNWTQSEGQEMTKEWVEFFRNEMTDWN